LTTEIIFSSESPIPNPESIFEKYYITARQKEHRIYSLEQVKRLPDIEKTHTHAAEWKLRKQSSEQLVRYLKGKQRPLQILEVGCGNGWLARKLSMIQGSSVTGIDINKTEIYQAKTAFPENSNLQFNCTHIESISHADKFDVILFAASIQYFFSLEETIEDVLLRLKLNGEIHILDTPFYAPPDIEIARNRSQIYYRSIGLSEMAGYYFHHSTQSFKKFNFTFLYNPKDFKSKILGRKNPFPWVRIQRS
jgi:2-polyprenyl-3-methyl-5-hydroxy-6-metoxy-1,4-benzoquinol methylase